MLLAFKLVLGMMLLSFARSRFKSMKEREKGCEGGIGRSKREISDWSGVYTSSTAPEACDGRGVWSGVLKVTSLVVALDARMAWMARTAPLVGVKVKSSQALARSLCLRSRCG